MWTKLKSFTLYKGDALMLCINPCRPPYEGLTPAMGNQINKSLITMPISGIGRPSPTTVVKRIPENTLL